MKSLLSAAGFNILSMHDSTEESLNWIETRTARLAASDSTPITTSILFEDDFGQMVQNQIRGLKERRIRTVSFVCEA
jgi:hypothetical protein